MARDTPHWTLGQIDFDAIEVDRIAHRDDLFILVCSASLIESGSDTYAGNLAERFADDGEVADWLTRHWEAEELQHGRALRAYVEHVWPDFDWAGAFASFFAEYGELCVADELEPTRGQELAARCVVEMGTTTYYQALGSLCDEPVLRDLVARIRDDEVSHYKRFYHDFRRYRDLDALSRRQVLAAVWRRVAELRDSDAEIALRHVAARRWPDGSGAEATARARDALRGAYPTELAVRMALKPLGLAPWAQRWAVPPIAAAVRRLM